MSQDSIDRINFYSGTECPSDETFQSMMPTDRVAFVCISSVWQVLKKRLRDQRQIEIWRGSGFSFTNSFKAYDVCHFGTGEVVINHRTYAVVCKGDSLLVECLAKEEQRTKKMVEEAIARQAPDALAEVEVEQKNTDHVKVTVSDM
jgi:hypothetical protein